MCGLLRRLCLIFVASACAASGCKARQQWDAFWGIGKKPPAEVKGSRTASISIEELSRRLSLRVAEVSSGSATLIDADNTLVIVADPGGRVYLNGKAAAFTGPIRAVGGVLCVPASVVAPLRRMLRPHGGGPKTVDGAMKVRPYRRGAAVVVVDPGHGGKDPGAVRTYGSGRVRVQIREKDLNLDAALELARLLRGRGVRVVMTRSDDSTVSLDERVKLADRISPALMVSVHADAHTNRKIHGYTVYVGKNASPASLAAAKKIERRLAKTGVYSKGVRRHEKLIRVLVKPKCPSVLVEMGYLSNEAEAARLQQAGHRLLLAGAIAEGVMDLLKDAKK